MYDVVTSIPGHCLCGATRYSFSGPMLWRAHCHCESCRRNTSSPVTTFFAVTRNQFAWTGDEPGAYSSSLGVTRLFCKSCSTPMSYENSELAEGVHLYAASLDDHSHFCSQRRDFCNEKVAWLNVSDDLPKHEE
jgi:hypothetical protein